MKFEGVVSADDANLSFRLCFQFGPRKIAKLIITPPQFFFYF